MARVVDVAQQILRMTGGVTTMKLQKLVYYCQAYHLVANRTPLFGDRIEAWPNGPVIPTLFSYHRGRFIITADDLPNANRPLALSEAERASIKRVIVVLGHWTSEQLIQLTHSESPWINARAGLEPWARSNREISQSFILNCYSSPSCKNPVFT